MSAKLTKNFKSVNKDVKKPSKNVSKAKESGVKGFEHFREVALKPLLRQAGVLVKAQRAVKTSPGTAIAGWFSLADGKDTKTLDEEKLKFVTDQLGALRSAARSALGGKMLRTHLWQPIVSITPAAGVAVLSSIPLIPANSAEWSAYSGLYDEARVTGVEVHYMVGQTVTSTAALLPAGTSWVGVGYDSTYNTTPTSVMDVLESSQHELRAANTGSLSNIPSTSVVPHSSWVFHIRIPNGPVANAAAVTGGTGITANFPGQWMAVGDTGDSVGYLRVATQPLFGTGVISMTYIIKYLLEFRERT